MSHQRFRGSLKAHSRSRIEQLLYRTVRLTENLPRDNTALLLAAQRNPAKFTKYTQNLLLWHGQASDRDACAMLLLSLCTGISRLSLFDSKPAMLPALDNMRVNHLSVSLAHLFRHPPDPRQIDLGRPLFQAVTHLEVWDASELVVGLRFAQLPSLTHLCVTEYQDLPLILSVLKKSDKFCILVNMYWSVAEFERFSVDDPRLVLMTIAGSMEHIADWEARAEGGQDFWARAEKFIAKKKGGEIEPGRIPAYQSIRFH
jgi:hypothetical protein